MRLLSMLIGRISVNTDFFDYICPVYPYFLTNETALLFKGDFEKISGSPLFMGGVGGSTNCSQHFENWY